MAVTKSFLIVHRNSHTKLIWKKERPIIGAVVDFQRINHSVMDLIRAQNMLLNLSHMISQLEKHISAVANIIKLKVDLTAMDRTKISHGEPYFHP